MQRLLSIMGGSNSNRQKYWLAYIAGKVPVYHAGGLGSIPKRTNTQGLN